MSVRACHVLSVVIAVAGRRLVSCFAALDTLCLLVDDLTTPNPSNSSTVQRQFFQCPQRSAPFRAYKVPAMCDVALPSYIAPFPSSLPPSFLPSSLSSFALPPSASSHPWRHLTRSSPHSLSSVSYSVPFPFIGTWKVKPRPNAPFFRCIIH